MDLKAANVLITGGSDGIGYGLAQRFWAAGSDIMITGRNVEKLQRAAERLPGLKIFRNDISMPTEREALSAHVKEQMPDINIVINNAGFQRRVALPIDDAPWSERQNEIDTLLSGPVHLNHLILPLILSNNRQAIIINVTSGGAYIPQVFAPVYSACKAALHSYTVVLRYSLSATNCRVVELIPPAVKTGLSGIDQSHGASLDAFCHTIFPQLTKEGVTEIGFGVTNELSPELSGKKVDELFKNSCIRNPTELYIPM